MSLNICFTSHNNKDITCVYDGKLVSYYNKLHDAFDDAFVHYSILIIVYKI